MAASLGRISSPELAVIGRRPVPLLCGRGFEVIGTTRFAARAGDLERLGAAPIIVDVFDRKGIARAVAAVQPSVVIHQLTDLSGGFVPEHLGETLARNARIRSEGTRNL